MAGIYIKGMEMPTNCDDCRLGIDCAYDESQVGYKMMGGRPRNCPLIPVPDHGDLIERDKAVQDLRMDYAYAAAKIVALQPTIINADKEGEA